MSIALIAFVAAGLAVVPAFVQDAEAVKKDKGPKKDKSDFIIDEPVIKLVKEKDKGPKKNRG